MRLLVATNSLFSPQLRFYLLHCCSCQWRGESQKNKNHTIFFILRPRFPPQPSFTAPLSSSPHCRPPPPREQPGNADVGPLPLLSCLHQVDQVEPAWRRRPPCRSPTWSTQSAQLELSGLAMLPKVEERPRLKLGKCPRPRDYLFSFQGKNSTANIHLQIPYIIQRESQKP